MKYFTIILLFSLSIQVSAANKNISDKTITKIKAYNEFVAVEFSPKESSPMCTTNDGSGSTGTFFILTDDNGSSVNEEMITSMYMARALGEKITVRYSEAACTTSPALSNSWDAAPLIYRLVF